jgi:FkbM family methyltransferase
MLMISSVYAAKSFVNRGLRRVGYRIERIADLNENGVDVFWLGLRLAMARAGSNFFFVQIGANNGVSNDPIHEFVVKYHLSGVLIEPQPLIFQELKKNYAAEPQLIFENAAISPKDGEAKMYCAKAENGETTSGLTTFRREVLEYELGGRAKIEEINVPAKTFQAIFARHAIRRVDLLQIDTEGFDCEILRLFDFIAYSPTIIRFEHIHLSRLELTEAITKLSDLGYQLHRDAIDLVAIRND